MYRDRDIESELTRCKAITGTPTTIKQISMVSEMDRSVFQRYFSSHSDPDVLVGEAAKKIDHEKYLERREKTNLERYGDPHYNNREKLKESIYDVSIKEAIERKIEELGGQTTIKHLSEVLPYSIWKIDDYVKHFQITGLLTGEDAARFNAERGVEKRKAFFRNNPQAGRERAQRASETKLERYGSSGYNNAESRRNTLLDSLAPEFAEVYYDREKSIKLLEEHRFETREQIRDYFHTTSPAIENWIRRNDLRDIAPHLSEVSSAEVRLREYLEPLGFTVHNTHSVIPPYEIDIYNPDRKIGVEFNGTFWHSDAHLKDKEYHFKKSEACSEKGVRLIHIYEWEWEDERTRKILESIIRIACGKVENRIYARKCEIREITNSEARPFNDANHLQGHRNAQVTYGLFYQDKLVQLMSFSRTRYNRNLRGENDWEIIRGCPGSNNVVVGGVSKLFKHFLREHDPDRVFSYCDFNKFDGVGYEEIGMEFTGYTGPDKTWIVDGLPVKRNPKRYKELKAKAQAIVWGSGSKKYLYTNTDKKDKDD